MTEYNNLPPNLAEIRRREIKEKGISYNNFTVRVQTVGLEEAIKLPKQGKGGNYKRFYDLKNKKGRDALT